MIEPRMVAVSFAVLVLFLTLVATWRRPAHEIRGGILPAYLGGIVLMILGQAKGSEFLQDLGSGFGVAMIAFAVIYRFWLDQPRPKQTNAFNGSH